jgi:hypothetical protein
MAGKEKSCAKNAVVPLLLFTANAVGPPATAAFAVAGIGVSNEARLVGVVEVGTAMSGRIVISSSLIVRNDSLIVCNSLVKPSGD